MTEDSAVRTGSLRRRVVLAVLALLLVVLLSLGLLVNLVLGDRLRSDLRQRLVDRAGLAQVLVTENLDTQSLTDRLTGQGVVASYQAGSTVITGRDQPPPNPGGPNRPRGPRPSAPTAAVTITQRGELLQSSLPFDNGTLTLTSNLVDIDRTLSTLKRIELAFGAGTLLVTGILLTLLVGVALAPLSRMTMLANRIRDGARGRRLRPTRPSTDLGRTAAAFDGMLDALEAAEAEAVSAEARMRQFLADASHDLRTPIAGVITTAELVLRDNPVRSVREERLVALIREAQRAGRLVDDLLLMARLDGGAATVQLRAIDAVAAARTAAARADGTGGVVVVDAPTPSWVLADADAVDRVLANLLDNARRAAGPGGTVEVTVRCDTAALRIGVRDSGPGVPPADRDRIFDRFIRLDTGRRRVADSGGTGLGLPIARGLARSMGGEVTLLATGPGAYFELTLPVIQPSAAIVRPETAGTRR